MTVLFGVGTGGFGAAVHQRTDSRDAGTVANNYYLEMLAELGLVGFILFVTFVVSLLYRLVTRRQFLLIAIIAGYLVQWYFFSGNADVIHVWVVIGLALAVSSPTFKRRLLQ